MKLYSLLLVGSVMLVGVAPVASGALIQIQLGGVDLRYDGTNIFDGGTSSPDPLTNATFLVDGVKPGEDTADVTLDLMIPGVTNIPVGGGQVISTAGGSLDLDLGDGEYLSLALDTAVVTYIPVTSTMDLDLGDGEYLSLALDTAVVTYIPVTSTIQYVFVGSTASSTGENLPYLISIEDPISVSFSTQIMEAVSHSGGFLTAFKTAGTGEIQGFGVGIPEPATLSLLALGGLALIRRRRR